MTSEELATRTVGWREASKREQWERKRRDRLILQALAEGMSQRAVAEAVGVSHGLPAIILKKEEAARGV